MIQMWHNITEISGTTPDIQWYKYRPTDWPCTYEIQADLKVQGTLQGIDCHVIK